MGFKLKESAEVETKDYNVDDVVEDYTAMNEYNNAMNELDRKILEANIRKDRIEDFRNSSHVEKTNRMRRGVLSGVGPGSSRDSGMGFMFTYIICGIMVICAMVFFGKAIAKNKESKLDSVEVIGVITDMDREEKRVRRNGRYRWVTEYKYTYEWEDEYGVLVQGSRTYSSPTFVVGENVRITVMADDYSVEIDSPESAKRKMGAYAFSGVLLLGLAVFMFVRQKKNE